MGDFFNEIVIFLEEYYVYVIGVGLILVLMLVGLLASRKKAKKGAQNEEPMANINEVNTGSINDVADTVQNDAMQPTNVVTFPEDNSSDTMEKPADVPTTIEPQAAPEVAPSPVAEPIITQVSNDNAIPANDTTALSMSEANPTDVIASDAIPMSSASIESVSNEDVIADTTVVKPIVEENKSLEEITPVEEDRFDKTEIIDFSTATAEKPEDIKPVEARPFIIDDSQFANSQNMLNGENDSDEVPKV